MKKTIVGFCVLMMFQAIETFSYTLPLDAIINELVRNTRAQTSAQFIAAIATNGETRFIDVGGTPLKNISLKELLPDVLSFKSVGEWKAYMKQQNVDDSIVSQGLFDYEPVFIIGARPEEKKPQIWIDKNFHPIKIVTPSLMITMEKWTSLQN